MSASSLKLSCYKEAIFDLVLYLKEPLQNQQEDGNPEKVLQFWPPWQAGWITAAGEL